MIPASIPEGELSRLAVLRSYGILDTPPEERFDRLTRLVADQLDVPIALVSLVDTNRQWFKSKVGLGASETPREIAFCSHAILGDETFVVENALTDERFHDNPLVSEDPAIRFYAGAPLLAASGHRLGTLCAIDREPRVLSDSDERLLRTLASVVVDEMELSAVGDALSQHAGLLEKHNDALDAFIHALSYELAAPIRQIRSFCEILDIDPTADREECLRYIVSSADQADNLMNELRIFFTVDRVRSTLECDTGNCLERAIQGLSAEMQQASASVEITGSMPEVTFFPELLTLLFKNLLSNSLKYRSMSDPNILIHFEQKENEWVCVVDDNGIGVAKAHRRDAFKLLRRLHKQQDISGAGMGLAICDKIVRRGGGSIRLDESSRGGARVIFSIPKVHPNPTLTPLAKQLLAG